MYRISRTARCPHLREGGCGTVPNPLMEQSSTGDANALNPSYPESAFAWSWGSVPVKL